MVVGGRGADRVGGGGGGEAGLGGGGRAGRIELVVVGGAGGG